MSKNLGQLEFDFGSFGRLKVDKKGLENSIGDTIDKVVESTSNECNAAITQVYIDSERVVDTTEDSVKEEYIPKQILDRRQELLKNRKRFVQTVLDAIYDKYKTEIDKLILDEPKWQTLLKTNSDRDKIVKIVKRLGVARFIKQIVLDDKNLTDLLKIKVNIDGSKKVKKQIKNLPYIKSFLARCRLDEDRLLPKGDEDGEIAARNFQKIKEALKDYGVEVLKEFKVVDKKKITYTKRVNGKMISLKTTLKYPNLRNKIVDESNSITDKKSFEGWLKTNFSFERVSIENSDENILFCVFVTSLRKIVGKKILPCKIDTIELYKSLLNGRFIPKTLYSSPFKMNALDATFIEYRDSLWKSYIDTPDFFTKYPSYYFWFKYAKEATYLHKSHLKDVWGMIPDAFRSDGRNDDKWSKIDLPFKDADNLYTAFEKVQNSWVGNPEAKAQFFTKYPSYYFWLKDVVVEKGLKKSHLGHVWGMIPGEFRKKWNYICLPFEDADKLHKAFEEVENSWVGNPEAKEKFFEAYPSYYLWLKDVAEAQDLNESHLGHVWGMIPDEFREQWSNINLPFEDADKLHKVFEEVRNSWNGNKDVKAQFFVKYPSYYFWLKAVAEEKGLKKSNLGSVWGMIPNQFRKQWSSINLSFEDADKLHKAFEEVRNSWNGNDEEKDEFFAQYPSYYFWFKYAKEAKGLIKMNLGNVWGMIPGEFRKQWSCINLSFKEADKLHSEILKDSKTWGEDDKRAYMQHFSETNLQFSWYWGLIPTSLRKKFNLEYYHPGKIFYNGIKVDSKQEFAVLRVFEKVLGYRPKDGVNFQVKEDSNSRHTFDFKIEYQENGVWFTHFFEWHPVVVSMSGGRNDASGLDEYQDIVELIDDDYLTDSELITYAQGQVEKEYYKQRLGLLNNNTTKTFGGDVRLTCATAGDRTGGLNKNLATLHEFLQQANPDFELTLAQLTTMFKGYLNEAMDYEVQSDEGA